MLTTSNQSSMLPRLATATALLCAGVFSISAFHPEIEEDSFESDLSGFCFPTFDQERIIPGDISDPFAMLEYTSKMNAKRYQPMIQMSMFEVLPSSNTAIQNQNSDLAVAQQPAYYEVKFGGKTFYKLANDDSGLYYKLDKNRQVIGKYKELKNVITTAYTWVDGIGDPAAGDPRDTQTGKDATNTYGIAADYKAVPVGTIVFVPGYGEFPVDDKCGRARQAWRGDWRTLRKLGVDHKEIKKDTHIILDLRIPNYKTDGSYRSDEKIQEIALEHGVQLDRTVLIKVN